MSRNASETACVYEGENVTRLVLFFSTEADRQQTVIVSETDFTYVSVFIMTLDFTGLKIILETFLLLREASLICSYEEEQCMT